MKKYIRMLWWFFVLVMPASLVGQHHVFQQYTVNKGLPHGQIHSLSQTSDGYIWAGTYGGGLVKFTGESFTTFTTADGLKDNSVEFIYEDHAHNLWVATYQSGIAKMKGKKFVYPFEDTSLDTADVYGIGELRTGKLWIATLEAGFYLYDGTTLEQFTSDEGLVSNTVWDVWEDEDGNIWIAANGGVSVFDGTGFTNYTTEDGLSGTNIFRVTPHPDGSLWFATSNGITIWEDSTFTAVHEIGGIQLDYIYDLIADSKGNMWIGTYANGVLVYKERLRNHFTQTNGLTSNFIYDLFEDQDGQVWIATDGGGINLYEGGGFMFYRSESGLSTGTVNTLFKDSSGNTWAGTDDGVFVKKDRKFKKITLPIASETKNEIWDIAELPNGDLLFLTEDNTIYRYNGRDFSNFSRINNLDSWFTYQLYIDQDNALWIATDVGLFYKKGEEFIHYTTEDGLPSSIVYQVYEHNNFVWIATYNGISRFDGTDFKNYRAEEGLGHRQVNFITHHQEDLWLGTGGGITFLDLDEEGEVVHIKNFGTEIGMELLTTLLLWFDESGHLWQGTNGGINRLDVPGYMESGEMQLLHYPLSDRGIGIETNQYAVIPVGDNRAWLGTMEGILELRPSELEPAEDNFNLYITSVYRNSQLQGADSTTHLFGRTCYSEMNFSYGQHTFEIEYDALVYGNTSNLRYRYKLEGFDDEWSEPAKSQSAIFTNLDPGDYSFIVQAKDQQHKWGNNEARLNFSIAYPFWQTYWFYLLVGISLAGLSYGYIQFHLQRAEKNRLSVLVNERTRDLQEALGEKEVLIKEIHHRVKNNLAVISGLLELQVSYSDDKFSEKVLRESQRRVQSISMIHEKLYQNKRLAEINFKKYIEELAQIIASSFYSTEKDIQLEVKVAHDIHLSIDQGIPCGLILNELLSNAYEHAFKNRTSGTITVAFTEGTDGYITFSVQDNGVGLPEGIEEKKADSLGLTLIETLTRQLEGTISMDQLENGTCFTITFQKEEPDLQVPIDS